MMMTKSPKLSLRLKFIKHEEENLLYIVSFQKVIMKHQMITKRKKVKAIQCLFNPIKF